MQNKKRNFFYVGLIPLALFIMLLSLGFDGLYGQDSYEYIRYATRFKNYLLGGEFPGDVVWPKVYLIILSLKSFVFPISLAGQIISLASLYLTYYFLKRIIEEIHGKQNQVQDFLVLAFLISPYVLRISVVVMADTFAMLSLVGAAYYTLVYHKTNSGRALTWGVLFGFLGVFSRYAILVPLTPIFLWAFIHWIKIKKWKHALVLLIPLGLFLLNQFFEGNGSKFANHHLIENWSILHVFQSEFTAPKGIGVTDNSYLLPNGVFYFFSFFHPGFFVLVSLALVLNLKRVKQYLSQTPWAFLMALVLYSLFLSGITFQGNRYITLTYPLFLVFAFPAFKDFTEHFKKYYKLLFYGLLIFQLALFVRAMKPSYEMNKLERTLASEMKTYEGQVLYSFEVDISLQQRQLDFDYLSLWKEEYDSFEKGAYVLFNEERIAKKYSGMNPMKNWNRLNTDYHLKLIQEIHSGWNLYQVENK